MLRLVTESTGGFDPDTLKKVGRLHAVDAILTGSITDFGSSLDVHCELIDTQTGEYLAVANTRIIKDEVVQRMRPEEKSVEVARARPGTSAEPTADQAIGRVAYVSGDVSYSRGDDPDKWQTVVANVPITLGDRLYTGSKGYAECQLESGSAVLLNSESNLSALDLQHETTQLSLQAGTATFRIRRIAAQDPFEVDTPNVAVTFDREGEYRIDVDKDGNDTRVAVRSGQATVAAGGGQVPLSANNQMDISGTDAPQYDVVPLPAADSWDRRVNERKGRSEPGKSAESVNANVVGKEDLDQYGEWSNIPTYGHVWTPLAVEAGWQPYRTGHWGWQDPWGWTWIAEEPWGWAPYHYGRWVTYSERWFWVPPSPSDVDVTYSPALVAFVGGGPGWSTSMDSQGSVGWFPLAPGESIDRWWGSPRNGAAGTRNGGYANRRYLTAVSRKAFASGGSVARSSVRDPAVLRLIAAAPVLRGPLPVVPDVGSVASATKPPAGVLSRPVVTRLKPPPAPPSFQSKLVAIRENRGAPMTSAGMARMAIRTGHGSHAIIPIRSAAAAAGRVTLAARNSHVPGPRPQPLVSAPIRPVQQPLVPRSNGSGPSSPSAGTSRLRNGPPAMKPLSPRNGNAPVYSRPQPPGRTAQPRPYQEPARGPSNSNRPASMNSRSTLQPGGARQPAPPPRSAQPPAAKQPKTATPPPDKRPKNG